MGIFRQLSFSFHANILSHPLFKAFFITGNLPELFTNDSEMLMKFSKIIALDHQPKHLKKTNNEVIIKVIQLSDMPPFPGVGRIPKVEFKTGKTIRLVIYRRSLTAKTTPDAIG